MHSASLCHRPPPILFEQCFNIGHRPKQLHGLILKWQKTLPLVKSSGVLVFGINDDRERGDFASRRAIEGIGKEKAAIAFSLLASVNRETTDKRRRDQRVSRQLAHKLRWQFREVHRSG